MPLSKAIIPAIKKPNKKKTTVVAKKPVGRSIGSAWDVNDKLVPSVIVSRRNGPLIAAAARLWIKPTDTVLDVTYGIGRFWTDYKHNPKLFVKHDKFTVDGVDFCSLPEKNESFDVVVFDPPYVSQGGRKTKRADIVLFKERYGIHRKTDKKTAGEGNRDSRVRSLIGKGLHECVRVVKKGGICFVKCMDYISSGLELGHFHVVETMLQLGMEQVDELIHLSGNKPQPLTNPDGSDRKQHHSRHVHSFLCIFRKPRGKSARKQR